MVLTPHFSGNSWTPNSEKMTARVYNYDSANIPPFGLMAVYDSFIIDGQVVYIVTRPSHLTGPGETKLLLATEQAIISGQYGRAYMPRKGEPLFMAYFTNDPGDTGIGESWGPFPGTFYGSGYGKGFRSLGLIRTTPFPALLVEACDDYAICQWSASGSLDLDGTNKYIDTTTIDPAGNDLNGTWAYYNDGTTGAINTQGTGRYAVSLAGYLTLTDATVTITLESVRGLAGALTTTALKTYTFNESDTDNGSGFAFQLPKYLYSPILTGVNGALAASYSLRYYASMSGDGSANLSDCRQIMESFSP